MTAVRFPDDGATHIVVLGGVMTVINMTGQPLVAVPTNGKGEPVFVESGQAPKPNLRHLSSHLNVVSERHPGATVLVGEQAMRALRRSTRGGAQWNSFAEITATGLIQPTDRGLVPRTWSGVFRSATPEELRELGGDGPTFDDDGELVSAPSGATSP